MSKTRRFMSKETHVDEQYEGPTRSERSRSEYRKNQRKFKEALRTKDWEIIDDLEDHWYY